MSGDDPNAIAETGDTPQRLDKRLRNQARAVAHSMERFKSLIDETKAKQIHEVLGFKSWTAYIADVIGKEMKSLPVDDRRQIVALLAGEGMSNRAIAEAVGVNEITVRRDKDVRHDVAPERPRIVYKEPVREPPRQIKLVVGRADDPGAPPVPLPPEEQARIKERLREYREKLAQLRAGSGSVPVDLDQGAAPEPATIVGLDGKRYSKPQPQPPKPKPSNTFADRFYRVLSQLQSNALQLEKLTKMRSSRRT